MGKKIKLSHTEVEVKLLLEVLGVYAVLATALVGIYYLEPTITGFVAATKQISTDANWEFLDSGNLGAMMLSLSLILVFSSLIYGFVSELSKEDKNKKLMEIKEIKDSIGEKKSRIRNLKEKITEFNFGKKRLIKEIMFKEWKIERLKKDKRKFAEKYYENLESKEKLSMEYLNELEDLKKKYGNKEKGEFKELLTDLKEELKEEYECKKDLIGRVILDEDSAQKQKEINRNIKKNEIDINESNKYVRKIEKMLRILNKKVQKLEKEKEGLKGVLKRRKKEFGSLVYFISLFRFKGKARPKKEEAAEEHEAERHLTDLRNVFKKRDEEKRAFIPEEKRIRNEIEKKRDGKSRKFVECHKLLLRANEILQRNDIAGAKMLYLKTMRLYTELEYVEKKEIYNDLMGLYRKIGQRVSMV